MTTKTCTECLEPMARAARKCPHCGSSIYAKQNRKAALILFAVIGIPAFIVLFVVFLVAVSGS